MCQNTNVLSITELTYKYNNIHYITLYYYIKYISAHLCIILHLFKLFYSFRVIRSISLCLFMICKRGWVAHRYLYTIAQVQVNNY